MHITCINKREQKRYKLQKTNCLKKLLDANNIDKPSQPKKKKPLLPNRHTDKKPLRDKKKTKQRSNAETKRQTKKSKFYNL